MDNYEEKYKEALERARKSFENSNGMILKKWLCNIFPELAESEDAKIREELIEFVKGWKEKAKHFNSNVAIWTSDEEECDRYIAWLEKQCKEKYALNPSKKEDVRKFMEYIEKQAKAYDINFPFRGFDIYAFAKDILSWLQRKG